MKIVKMNKLAGGLIEVEFDNGTKSQFREEALAEEGKASKPEDFRSQIKEIYSNDLGAGKEQS